MVSCGKSQSQEKNQSTIQFDKENVIDFSDNKVFEGQEISYKEVGKVNYAQKELVFLNCVGWENDPGDFRKLKIGDTEFVNMGGWVKVPEEYSFYSEDGYFLEWDLGNNTSVVVLFGYVYASDPGYLSVINLSSNPELIFNRQVMLKEVQKNGNIQVLVVTIQDQDYRLYIDNNTLKLEKT